MRRSEDVKTWRVSGDRERQQGTRDYRRYLREQEESIGVQSYEAIRRSGCGRVAWPSRATARRNRRRQMTNREIIYRNSRFKESRKKKKKTRRGAREMQPQEVASPKLRWLPKAARGKAPEIP